MGRRPNLVAPNVVTLLSSLHFRTWRRIWPLQDCPAWHVSRHSQFGRRPGIQLMSCLSSLSGVINSSRKYVRAKPIVYAPAYVRRRSSSLNPAIFLLFLIFNVLWDRRPKSQRQWINQKGRKRVLSEGRRNPGPGFRLLLPLDHERYSSMNSRTYLTHRSVGDLSNLRTVW